jgi:hypothetical protein
MSNSIRIITSVLKVSTYIITKVNVSLPITTVTVKPADEVTSIKQSPVLNGHLFLFQSWNISYELSLF